jgi:nucleotide-binding universal stress UspA family protein
VHTAGPSALSKAGIHDEPGTDHSGAMESEDDMPTHDAKKTDRTYRNAILVGVDGSAESSEAVRWAADEAGRRRSQLLIVHASDSAHFGLWTTTATIRQGLRTLAQPIVDRSIEVARDVDPHLQIQGKVGLGSPGSVILRMSTRVDLVAVGRSGKGALSRALLGSVAKRLATQSHTPVALIANTDSRPIDRIVLAIGDRETDGHAGEFAFAEAVLRGVPVRVIHAWHVPALPTPGVPGPLSYPAYLKELADRELADAVQRWRPRFPDVPVTSTVLETTPVTALKQICAPTDLLVLGHNRHGALASHSLGHVIGSVLHSVACATVVVGEPAIAEPVSAAELVPELGVAT